MNILRLYSILSATAAISLGGGSLWAAVPDFGDGSLKLWLDADAITNLTSGQSVSLWNDSSGNGIDVSQATAASRPIYLTNGGPAWSNALPVVRFDGTDDYLGTAGNFNIASSNMTVFALLTLHLKESGYFQDILGNRAGGEGFYLAVFSGGAFGFVAGTNPNTDIFTGPGGSAFSAFDGATVFTGLRNSSVAAGYTNGVSVGSIATAGGAVGGATTFDIGLIPSGGGFMNGDFNEVLIYDRALSPQEQTQVEWYLISQVPEPSSVALSGLGGLLWLRARRKK